MAIDIRAVCTCSLGTLISASISDDYVQGTGLIRTKGNCELSGIYTPAVGTAVTFSYTKAGVTRQVPRTLFVLSSFADPFRRTTTVELGCRLTYLQNKKDSLFWTYFDDPQNSGTTSDEAKIITHPIFAASAAAWCAGQLGISGTPGLSNHFSVARFDFSAGYVNVLSDLMVSEGWCGYMSGATTLSTFSLDAAGGTGPVIDSSKIIDLGPIGVGQLPGDAVSVSYSTLKLKDPDPQTADLPATAQAAVAEETPDDTAKGGWERDVTVSPKQIRYFVWTDATNTQREKAYTYQPQETTSTKYDDKNRVIKRISVSESIGADTNSSYVQAELQVNNNSSYATIPTATTTYTFVTYKKSEGKTPAVVDQTTGTTRVLRGVVSTTNDFPPSPLTGDTYKVSSECFKEYFWDGSQWTAVPQDAVAQVAKSEGSVPVTDQPDANEEVASEITVVYEPINKILGSVSPGYIDANGDLISLPGGETISSQTEVYYDTIKTDQSQYTKRRTVIYKAYAYTQRGQQEFAMRVQDGQNINSSNFINSAVALVFDGVETQTTIGRDAYVQKRPSKSELLLQTNSTKNTAVTPSIEASSASVTTSEKSQQNDNGGYSTQSTSELEFAVGSPLSQNRIELSLPYAPDDIFIRGGTCPNVTYHAVPSDAASKAAAYGRTQNRLLLGNRYGMNIQTLPELLPSAPFAPFYIQANGLTAMYRVNGTNWQLSADGILVSTDALFWGAVGGSGTFWFPVAPGITSLPSTPAVVGGNMTVSSVVPVWNETVKTEARVRVGLTVISLAYALELLTVPDPIRVRVGLTARRVKKVEAPAATITVAAVAPEIATGVALYPPAVAVTVDGAAPLISASSTSANIYPPAVSVDVAGAAPTVTAGPSDANFASVGLLLHLNGSNGSTTFTDSSSNAQSVSSSGGPIISTAQSVFGGASAQFTYTSSQYLSVSSSAVSLAGSTNPWTVEARVYASSAPGTASYRGLWYNGSLGSISNSWQFYLDFVLSGDFRFYVRAVDGSNTVPIFTRNASYTRSINTWYAVAYVYDGTNLSIYVDGVLDSTTAGSSPAISAGNNFYIGMSRRTTATVSYGNGNFFDGYIDEFRITKGVARYSSAYTIAGSAFPNA